MINSRYRERERESARVSLSSRTETDLCVIFEEKTRPPDDKVTQRTRKTPIPIQTPSYSTLSRYQFIIIIIYKPVPCFVP